MHAGVLSGYQLPSFASMWLAAEQRVTPQQWHKAILAFANHLIKNGTLGGGTLKWIACGGGCNDCKGAPVQPHNRTTAVVLHAVELVPRNVQLLRTIARATGLEHVVHVHHAAGSNSTGEIRLEHSASTSRFGQEDAQACVGARCRMDAMVVRQLTIDELVQESGLRTVRHVSIDTEGWDPLVLEVR